MNEGRNDPCPCGSGKKYKKCCLEKDEQEQLAKMVNMFPEKRSESSIDEWEPDEDDFYDKDFWGAYNIIEPTESLELAVAKLKKQQK
jgi:hypothetical protein